LYACVLSAQANEASLNQQYRSKILTLRHPFRSNSQNYDGSGNAIKPPPGQAEEQRYSQRAKLAAANSDGRHNAPGVIPPKPKNTPEPDYGGQIGRALVRGTDTFEVTIDENGNITGPALITPIGLGVDDSAAETIVKKWKFDPGQLNGKHVPTNMTLEVEYRRQK